MALSFDSRDFIDFFVWEEFADWIDVNDVNDFPDFMETPESLDPTEILRPPDSLDEPTVFGIGKIWETGSWLKETPEDIEVVCDII